MKRTNIPTVHYYPFFTAKLFLLRNRKGAYFFYSGYLAYFISYQHIPYR